MLPYCNSPAHYMYYIILLLPRANILFNISIRYLVNLRSQSAVVKLGVPLVSSKAAKVLAAAGIL